MVRQPSSVTVIAGLCWLLLTRTPTVEPFLFSNRNKYNPENEECEFPNGAMSYSGTLNITISGFPCESWTNAAVQFEDDQFSDGTVSKAKNYCRNPLPQTRTHVWCFAKKAPGGWQYCRLCPYTDYKGCHLRSNGSDYSGFVAFTRSNVRCQSWTSNRPHRLPDLSGYRFIDGSAKLAKNYCRNPTPQLKQGVWCYTEDSSLVWDYCEVCRPFRGKVVAVSATSAVDSVQEISQLKTRPSCLYFCLIYGDCTVADFDGYSYTCSHGEKIAYDKSPHGSSTLYVVHRVCPATALGNGRRSNDYLGTYIKFKSRGSQNGLKINKADTPSKCVMACVQFQNCVKVQFVKTLNRCYVFDTMYSKTEADPESDLYIIQRCKKNVIASEDTVPQENEEEKEPEPEIDPGFWSDIVDSPSAKEDNASLMDAVTFKVPDEINAEEASAQTQMNGQANALGTQTDQLMPTVKTVVVRTGDEKQSSVRGYAKKLLMAIIAFTVITVICTGYQIYMTMFRKERSIIEPTEDERQTETKVKTKRKKSKKGRKREKQPIKLGKVRANLNQLAH